MLKRSPAPVPGQRTLTFVLPLEWAGRASVVGNFNDWTPGRLTLTASDGVATASVDLPNDYIAVFRYLGEGDHWFDEPDADFVDEGGSVVLAATEPVEVPEPAHLPSPAQKAKKVSAKRRAREDEKARQAAEKASRKSKKLADKVTKAALKQRKAAQRMAEERERMATKLAKKAAKKA